MSYIRNEEKVEDVALSLGIVNTKKSKHWVVIFTILEKSAQSYL